MNKRVITTMLSCMLVMSISGCSNDKEQAKVQEAQPRVIENQVVLPGSWSKDYTRDEVKALYEEGLIRVEDTAKIFGLEEDYKIVEDEISKENEISVNDSYIYLDIEEPEANRLESMKYEFKQFGSDLASGQIVMKLGFNLHKQDYIDVEEFKFEETSLRAFSEAFTGVEDREYSELDEQIYNMIVGNGEVTSIENNLDGIKETITITDEFLLYKLETKEYRFK